MKLPGSKVPLRGRVVFVLGAGDRAGQAVALHLSALGAAIVAAGPELQSVVVTAGLIAASGGTVRVLEKPAPPLSCAAALQLSAEALEPPTDAVISSASVPNAASAAAELARLLGPSAQVIVLDAVPAGRERAAAEQLATRFLASIIPPPTSDGRPLTPATEM